MGRADRNIGENNLSFIETSALDASNVELAFQNILTGLCSRRTSLASHLTNVIIPEIYRIVSSKALEGDSPQNPLGERRQVVNISESQDSEQKQGCC